MSVKYWCQTRKFGWTKCDLIFGLIFLFTQTSHQLNFKIILPLTMNIELPILNYAIMACIEEMDFSRIWDSGITLAKSWTLNVIITWRGSVFYSIIYFVWILHLVFPRLPLLAYFCLCVCFFFERPFCVSASTGWCDTKIIHGWTLWCSFF